jgi:Spy/CpxP family protein refolding chaperone
MKILKLSVIAAVAMGALLAYTTTATAQDNSDKGGKGGKRGQMTVEQRLDRMTKDLTLTDAQKPKVKEVLEEQDKKMQGIRDLPQDERRTKFRESREEMSKKLKDILTPDQYKKWEENMQNFGKRGKNGGGKEGDSTEKKN